MKHRTRRVRFRFAFCRGRTAGTDVAGATEKHSGSGQVRGETGDHSSACIDGEQTPAGNAIARRYRCRPKTFQGLPLGVDAVRFERLCSRPHGFEWLSVMG